MKTNQQEALERLTALENEAKELRKIINRPDRKGPVTDRVKTFEDVLEEAGTTAEDFYKKCAGLLDHEIAQRQIVLIATVLNEGKKLTSNDYRYYPWFNVERAGFVFVLVSSYYSYSLSGLGPRLCFKTEALAEYAGRQFSEIYRKFYDED